MSKEELFALRKILDYLHEEEKDYEAAGDDRKSQHIFLQVKVLNEFLAKQSL